jgi:TolB-like protein/DNA-binding winged helix-turn-helix (wHTH) protein/Tfp pilus assembly protein PilF
VSCARLRAANPRNQSEWAISTNSSAPRIVRFGIYEVDLAAGEVRKAGMRQKLAGQPFQVLQALLERPGEIVTRDELRERMWPGNTFVDYELALKKAVNRVREVLGDSAESPHFVETIPRRGYRFIGSLMPVSAAAVLAEPSTRIVGQPSPALVAAGVRSSWAVKKLAAGIGVIAIGALAVWFNADKLRARIFARTRSPEISSIAVLPLTNLSNDPEQEYFSDGMTDELITDLAKIGKLRVISHTSVERYKQTKQALPEIARELGVDAIVEGRVMRSGERVRITAQLIDARTDQHLWAESYERDVHDVLRLQEEVARDIAAEIRINLTAQEQSRLAMQRKTSPSAYDAYLRGRHFWSQRNAESIAKAATYFQQALREDPGFAPAYSGLSDCYWVGWGARVDLKLADEYARKAISLQPDLAEGHASLGIVRLNEYQMRDAERELKRAIELNPSYAMAHHYYSGFLLSLGHADAALEENDRARQLDPFSIAVNTARMVILIGSRKYEQALEQGEKYAEIAPQSAVPHNGMARIYWLEGKAPQAIAEERKAAALEHFTEREHSMDEVAATYEKAGLGSAQLKAAQFMERAYQGRYDAITIAFQYGNIGNKAKVLQWLEKSRRELDGNFYLGLNTAPEFDFLRTDPRFRELLRRVNLIT